MFFKRLILFLGFGLASIFQLSLSNHLPNAVNGGFFSANLSLQNPTHFFLAQAQSQENTTTNKRPAPPPRIPPNRVKPGGGLDFARQSCTDSASLTALVPINNPVLTTQPYPSFLFYIPDAPTAIDYGEFALFTADEKQRIYRIVINFNRTPGIIKIDLPPSEQYALKEATYYHWYFRVYCQDSSDVRQSLDLDGWVRRIPLTSTVKSKIEATSPDIWYDAIAKVAENLMASPQSQLLRDRWSELLQHINLEHLADRPIVDVPQKQVDKDK